MIPAPLRQAMHLRAGDRLRIKQAGHQLVIEKMEPAKAKLVRSKFGRKVLKAPASAPAMTTAVVNDLLDELP